MKEITWTEIFYMACSAVLFSIGTVSAVVLWVTR